jgi:hypothetical protein
VVNKTDQIKRNRRRSVARNQADDAEARANGFHGSLKAIRPPEVTGSLRHSAPGSVLLVVQGRASADDEWGSLTSARYSHWRDKPAVEKYVDRMLQGWTYDCAHTTGWALRVVQEGTLHEEGSRS